jgi:hypothetical protein
MEGWRGLPQARWCSLLYPCLDLQGWWDMVELITKAELLMSPPQWWSQNHQAKCWFQKAGSVVLWMEFDPEEHGSHQPQQVQGCPRRWPFSKRLTCRITIQKSPRMAARARTDWCDSEKWCGADCSICVCDHTKYMGQYQMYPRFWTKPYEENPKISWSIKRTSLSEMGCIILPRRKKISPLLFALPNWWVEFPCWWWTNTHRVPGFSQYLVAHPTDRK